MTDLTDTWARIFRSLKYRILEEYGYEEDKESCKEEGGKLDEEIPNDN